MDTLIVYDTEGFILYQADYNANMRIPVGVPSLRVEVPVGKRAVSVDVTGETHVAVFEDLPKSQEQEIAELRQSVLELSMIIAGGAA